MTVKSLTMELSTLFARPVDDLVREGLLVFMAKEIWLAESEIADIRERYGALSKEALYQAIRDGEVPEHHAWEDYIV
jgi:hypothetical protein